MPPVRASAVDSAPRIRRTTRDRPWFKRARWWVLIVLGCAILVVAFGLHPFARAQTRKALDGIDGYDGQFQDARIGLFPLRYRVTRLKLTKSGTKKAPVFYAEEASAQLNWGNLLLGHLVGRIEAEGAKVTLEQPAPGAPPFRLPELGDIPKSIVIERVQVTKGEVLYEFVHEKGRPSVWFHGIEATLENVGSRPNLTKGPATLSARGKLQRTGTMSVLVTADPFAVPLTFAGRASVAGFDVAEMNGLIDAKNDIKLSHGVMDMKMRFESHRGRLEGVLDPHLELSRIDAGDKDLGGKLKAVLARTSLLVSEPTSGTAPSGKIAVRDDLTDPKQQLLPSLEKVVENGFLLGLMEGLKRHYAGHPSVIDGGHPMKSGGPPTDLKTGK